MRLRRVTEKIKPDKRARWKQEVAIPQGQVLRSPGFFSSTVGLNEAVIRRYVEYPKRVDKGHVQLQFEF